MTKVTTKLGTCQVRSETGHPCPRPAVVEIRGVPFCEQCACEQQAYFAIGEMTQELTVDRAKQIPRLPPYEPLVEALN
ncbi:MAG TPA: hypothetical protein VE288_06955 [Rubrobacteraceae bacterium]|nr:hypothetical protein [Rubrobacteraceae bacterium]